MDPFTSFPSSQQSTGSVAQPTLPPSFPTFRSLPVSQSFVPPQPSPQPFVPSSTKPFVPPSTQQPQIQPFVPSSTQQPQIQPMIPGRPSISGKARTFTPPPSTPIIPMPSRTPIQTFKVPTPSLTPVQSKGTGVVTMKPQDVKTTLVSSLSSPSSVPTEIKMRKVKTADMEWVNGLQAYVAQQLSNIMPKEMLGKYVTEEFMGTWIRAFTHVSYDLTDNYETLEFQGDKILGACLSIYLMEAYPRFTNAEYTEIVRACVETIANGKRAVRLGMDAHARVLSTIGVRMTIYGDIFEAFIAALHRVSEKIQPGLGLFNCRNYVTFVFNNENLQPAINERFGTGKTIVEQMFSKFGGHRLETKITHGVDHSGKRNSTASIIIDEYIAKAVTNKIAATYYSKDRSLAPILSPGVIGTATAYSDKAATNLAFIVAKRNLESIGITRDLSILSKKLDDMNEIADRVNSELKLKDYRVKLVEKLKKLGKGTTEFSNVRRLTGLLDGEETFTMHFLFKRPSGETEILSVGVADSAESAKALSIIEYLK